MGKKIQILLLGILSILLLFYLGRNNEEMVVPEELLHLSEVDYLEVQGVNHSVPIKIASQEDIQKILLSLEQLNGPAELEYPIADEDLLGVRIALKGYYPTGPIQIFEDKISFQGQARNASREIVNELVKMVEESS